jgi:S1-C subfamily serine protease
MKYVLGCLFSALLGAGFVHWLADARPHSADAQEGRFNRGPSLGRPTGEPRERFREPEPDRDFDRNADNAPPPRRGMLPPDDGLSPEERIAVNVYETCNKGVVNITTKLTKGETFLFLELAAEGAGSGSIIDRKGHILTNYHVVEDASHISCTLADGKSYDGTVVGADPVNDVAVLKIDAPEDSLFPIPLGDSGSLKVGMRVFAIGNPFGLERTMTTGIISSLNRTLQVYRDRSIKSIIQIDAAVNPGNSGGPLLNGRGEIIGVNTAIASKTGQNSGVGFAIPVNMVTRVVPELLAHGRYIRPESGILRVFQTEKGLLVAQITPNGPAEAAGLRGPKMTKQRRGPFTVDRMDRSAADLIIEVDGEKIKTADDFLASIDTRKPGDVIELTVVRDGKNVRVPLKLGKAETHQADKRGGK